MHLVMQLEISGLRGKHPYRNLQSLTCRIDDRGRTVSPFRDPTDTKAVTVQRMKRIENANVRGVCTQGIVGGWSFIPTFTVLFPPVDWHPDARAGYVVRTDTSYP
jgi:hypothetical protein